MSKLSVCIPVEAGMAAPLHLVEALLAKSAADIEIVVACQAADIAAALAGVASADRRLVLLAPASPDLPVAELWLTAVRAARGDWITLVEPEDMLEPDLPDLLSHLEQAFPQADALGWNAFQIDASADPALAATVPLPKPHHLSAVDKAQMLQAFFQWVGAQRAPRMPFGLHHGVIRRDLRDTILSHSGPSAWQTPLPQHEWAARVAILAGGVVLSNRPLSAVAVKPFAAAPMASPLAGFPFDAGLGITAGIAEIQARVLAELGSAWPGVSAEFVRACMIDCMLEHDPATFQRKAAGYLAALQRAPGGLSLSQGFRPQYLPTMPADGRRGLYGNTLLVDRFIGGARTAQDFFRVARGMMAPVAMITGRYDLLVETTGFDAA